VNQSPYEKVVEEFHHRLRNLMEETCEVLAGDKSLVDLKAKVLPAFRDDNGEEAGYHLYIEAASPDVEGKHGVDIEYAIHDGDAGDAPSPGMVSFSLTITGAEGLLLGGLAPYNYSKDFWIASEDTKAIRERLRLIEEVWSPYHAADVVAKFLKDKAPAIGQTRQPCESS
jgi:hypothetical protein